MAFDESLLEPADQKAGFDPSLLTPVDPATSALIPKVDESKLNLNKIATDNSVAREYTESMNDTGFTRATGGGLPGLFSKGVGALSEKVIEPAAAALMNSSIGTQLGIYPKVEAGKSVIPDSLLPLAKEKGVIPDLTRALQSFTTPGSLATLPLAAESKLAQTGYAAQSISQIPQSLQKLSEAETPQEKSDAATELGLNVGMAALMGKGLKEKPAGQPSTPTPDARQITSPTRLPQPEIRPSVGEQTPLRQQGEAAPARQAAADESPSQVQPQAPRQPVTPNGIGARLTELRSKENKTNDDQAEQDALEKQSSANNGREAFMRAQAEADAKKVAASEPPKVDGMKFIGKTQAAGKIPEGWMFNITEKGKESTIKLPAGSTAEDIASARDKKLAEYAAASQEKPIVKTQPSESVKSVTEKPRILTPSRTRELASMVKNKEPLPAKEIESHELKIPPNYIKEGDQYVFKPEPSVESITPLEPQSGSPAVPQGTQKFKVGRSPQLYSLVNRLDQTASERENGEQAVTIRNEQTGENHVVMESDLKPVKERTAEQKSAIKKSTVSEKMKSLGYTDAEISAMPKSGAKALADRGESSMVGMGAAVPAEFKGDYSRDVYGIAERVRQRRENAEMTDPTQPGKGIAPEASVERGRQLLKSGIDPEKVMSDFEKSNRASSDDFAVVRAHGELLARITNRTEENFGTNSPEYRAAYKTESDWSARTKAMQTEWAKSGHAQQGEVDIDTGTFSGLKRAYSDAHNGEELPIKDEEKAQKLAEENRRLFNENARLLRRLGDVADKETKPKEGVVEKIPTVQNVRQSLADYKGGKMTTPQVRSLWNYTKKNYINKGNADFSDIVQKVSTDLGLSFKDVANGLAQPKSVKKLTNELWRKQTDARRVVESAKRFVRQTNQPFLGQAVPWLARRMFALKVAGHGGVAFGTHAPMVAFVPKYWPTYFNDFGKMWKMNFSPAQYEINVQALRADPNFNTAARAGLVNDPYKVEDFNNPDMAELLGSSESANKVKKAFGVISGAGNRGYFALKILRQDMFNQGWNKLPATMQTPEIAKVMADDINHITGVVKASGGKNASLALFAPRLLMSRAAFLAGDPYKAIEATTTAMSPKKWAALPPETKFKIINQVKQKATILAVAYGLLEANKYLLKATGSKQQVNTTDPTKSDFMKFKGAGMDFSYGNAMLNMARLPVRLWTIGAGDGGKLKHAIYPDESMYSAAGEFARSQASPIASFGLDLVFKGDYQNRPLPQIPGYGKPIPLPKRLAAQGVKPYTWPEFFAEQVSPIPFEEAEREIWRTGFGLSPEQQKSLLKAAGTTIVMMGTGGRLTEDLQPKK